MAANSLIRRSLLAGVMAGALTGTLAACGSSSGSSNGANGVSGSSGAQFQARLNFAKCMRSHGIDIPDPTPSGGPAGGAQLFKRLDTYPRAQVTAAQKACGSYLRAAFGNENLTPAQREARRQQAVKFAQCMRSHGINIPDPVQGPGGGFGIRRALRTVDFNSPAFKSALTACRSVAPQFGRGGPGVQAGPGPAGPGPVGPGPGGAPSGGTRSG